MAASSSIAYLNKGLKSTYTAQDVREETELKMRSYANWGEFLVPGPLSIAILGELVFISADTDFAINRFTPDKKCTYIKHPESFRACLMQVCNDGWKAFNMAHTNMDKIRLLSLGIPNDVKLVVQTLMQEDQEIVDSLLPVQLKIMKEVSSKCLDLAKHVEGDFQRLIELISELIKGGELALTDALVSVITPEPSNKECCDLHGFPTQHGSQSPESDHVATIRIAAKAEMILFLSQSLLEFVPKDKIYVTKRRDQKSGTPRANAISNSFKNIEDSMKIEAECDFQKTAMCICEQGRRICQMLSSLQTKKGCQKDITSHTQRLVENALIFKVCCTNTEDTVAFLARMLNASKPMDGMEQSGKTVSSIFQVIKMKIEQISQKPKKKGDYEDTEDEQTLNVDEEFCDSQGHPEKHGSQSLESDHGPIMKFAAKADMILAASRSLLEFVSKDKKIDMKRFHQKSGAPRVYSISKTFKNIEDLMKNEAECDFQKTAMCICEQGRRICKMLEDHQTKKGLQEDISLHIQRLVESAEIFQLCCRDTKNIPAFQDRMAGSSGSLVWSSIQMIKMTFQQIKQHLTASKGEHHTSSENRKKRKTKEFDSILSEMRKLDVEEKNARKTLAKGLDALGEVREQWINMMQFFQMISNFIETCLNQNITEFVSQCEAVPAIPNYRHLDFIKDMLYGPAFQASNIAHLVHMISETYVQVSSQYLMDRISNLGTLMTLEPDNPEFKRARLELQGSCEEAQKGILELVQKNRDDFDEQIEKRIETINQNLKAALPAPSREEQKANEDTVRKDPYHLLKEISEGDEDQFV